VYAYAFARPEVMQPHVARLVGRYGVNRERFFVRPGRGISFLVLNASRPLFRNNPRLRRAVNFAINRKALVREIGPRSALPADQYLQPHQRAFRDALIYPATPNLRKANELAAGNRRGGKVVFYTRDEPVGHTYGAIVRANLARIGLDVKVKAFPRIVTFDLLPKRSEPWDIGWTNWLDPLPDGLDLHDFFDGRTLDDPRHANWSHFDSPRVNRRLDEVLQLRGPCFTGPMATSTSNSSATTHRPSRSPTSTSRRSSPRGRGASSTNPFFVLAVACLK
jgi:ABC-type transport system substrate-binding protein